jgi:hypothetical protein
LSPFEYESNLKDLFDLKDMMSDIRDDISGTVSDTEVLDSVDKIISIAKTLGSLQVATLKILDRVCDEHEIDKDTLNKEIIAYGLLIYHMSRELKNAKSTNEK